MSNEYIMQKVERWREIALTVSEGSFKSRERRESESKPQAHVRVERIDERMKE